MDLIKAAIEHAESQSSDGFHLHIKMVSGRVYQGPIAYHGGAPAVYPAVDYDGSGRKGKPLFINPAYVQDVRIVWI